MPSHCECACDTYHYFVKNQEINEKEYLEIKGIAKYLGGEYEEKEIIERENHKIKLFSLSDELDKEIEKRLKNIEEKNKKINKLEKIQRIKYLEEKIIDLQNQLEKEKNN